MITGIAVAAAIIIVGLFFVNRSLIFGTKAPAQSQTAQPTASDSASTVSDAGAATTAAAPTEPIVTTASGLQFQDEVVGTGKTAVAGHDVTVHYIGVLQNGQKFDSSRDRGVPLVFTLGAGKVIKGWDEGVAGMKVGGKRILLIPADLAYGAQAMGSIPANSTLLFEVELLDVK